MVFCGGGGGGLEFLIGFFSARETELIGGFD